MGCSGNGHILVLHSNSMLLGASLTSQAKKKFAVVYGAWIPCLLTKG